LPNWTAPTSRPGRSSSRQVFADGRTSATIGGLPPAAGLLRLTGLAEHVAQLVFTGLRAEPRHAARAGKPNAPRANPVDLCAVAMRPDHKSAVHTRRSGACLRVSLAPEPSPSGAHRRHGRSAGACRLPYAMTRRCQPPGGWSVRLRRRAEPGAAPATSAASAASATAHRGQHPPCAHEHAAAGTARSGGLVSGDTPGRHTGPAACDRLVDGGDDIQRTRA
jgi:hypothetical protein